MKTILSAACAAIIMWAGIANADDAVEANEAIELTPTQMDTVTAGDLTLPNNKKVMAGFDVPAPGPFHPTLMKGVGHEGPWHAHFNSHMIDCADC